MAFKVIPSPLDACEFRLQETKLKKEIITTSWLSGQVYMPVCREMSHLSCVWAEASFKVAVLLYLA